MGRVIAGSLSRPIANKVGSCSYSLGERASLFEPRHVGAARPSSYWISRSLSPRTRIWRTNGRTRSVPRPFRSRKQELTRI